MAKHRYFIGFLVLLSAIVGCMYCRGSAMYAARCQRDANYIRSMLDIAIASTKQDVDLYSVYNELYKQSGYGCFYMFISPFEKIAMCGYLNENQETYEIDRRDGKHIINIPKQRPLSQDEFNVILEYEMSLKNKVWCIRDTCFVYIKIEAMPINGQENTGYTFRYYGLPKMCRLNNDTRLFGDNGISYWKYLFSRQ